MNLTDLFLLIALILFAVAAIRDRSIVAAGLAFATAAFVVPGLG